MKKKAENTLKKIYKRPTSGSIKWKDAVALIEALGGEVQNRKKGSAYVFKLDGGAWFVHKPHPGDDLDKGAVEGLRNFLNGKGYSQGGKNG